MKPKAGLPQNVRLSEVLGRALRFVQAAPNKDEVFLNAFKPCNARHEAPLLKAHLAEQRDARIVAGEDRGGQSFDAQRLRPVNGVLQQECAQAFTLVVGVEVDRDVGSYEVAWPLIHEVKESQVADCSLRWVVVVLGNPQRPMIWRVLKKRRASRRDGGRVKVATTFACSNSKVVDLNDAGQIGVSRVTVGVVHGIHGGERTAEADCAA